MPDDGVERDGVERDGVELGVAGPIRENAGFRLAAFGALLIVVLFAGYGLGRLNNGTASASDPPKRSAGSDTAVTGTVVDENQPHAHGGGDQPARVAGQAAPDGQPGGQPGSQPAGQPGGHSDGHLGGAGSAGGTAGGVVGGLSLSSGGLTLVPERTDFTAGRAQRLTFRVVGSGGAPVTSYATVHDKLLHLIIVRRDLTGFQHLHPAMAADGTWGIDLTLAQPGSYRMITDFTAVVGGRQLATTLGGDLTVAGNYAPRALPAPAAVATAGGFTAAYAGELSTRASQPLLVSVTGADGKPTAVEPYLGAYGHLVVMRQGDLGYVHVHPEAQLVDGKVKFWVTMPSAGRYRMFFDFQVAGQVHTAEWTAALS